MYFNRKEIFRLEVGCFVFEKRQINQIRFVPIFNICSADTMSSFTKCRLKHSCFNIDVKNAEKKFTHD